MNDHVIGVTFSPPTPNGDFHLGHIAGPILGSDIYARARRLDSGRVGFVSSTDDNQTYVVTTADRLQVPPTELIETAFQEGSKTLHRAQISVDGYTTTDMQYEKFIRQEFDALKEIGLFEQRTVRLPVDPISGNLMTEAFVTGRCPACGAAARAGSCEICYRYNTPAEIVPDGNSPVHTAPAVIWVLDLEKHRAVLEEWYSSTGVLARPVLQRLLQDGLSGTLPYLPVTYPIDWGIETGWGPGPQRINAWPEITVGHTYWLRKQLGATEPLDQLTQYMGVDNGFYNVFVYPIVQSGLVRAGRLPTAHTVVTVANHYFQLSGRKFSTSKGHVVWAAEFFDRVESDSGRLALALLSPEMQETNYTAELATSLIDHEIAPRLTYVRELAAATAEPGGADRWTGYAEAAAGRYATAYDRTAPVIRTAAIQILNDIDYLRSTYPDAAADTPAAKGLLAQLAHWWSPVLPTLSADILSS